jgi:hypothetical protein
MNAEKFDTKVMMLAKGCFTVAFHHIGKEKNTCKY